MKKLILSLILLAVGPLVHAEMPADIKAQVKAQALEDGAMITAWRKRR